MSSPQVQIIALTVKRGSRTAATALMSDIAGRIRAATYPLPEGVTDARPALMAVLLECLEALNRPARVTVLTTHPGLPAWITGGVPETRADLADRYDRVIDRHDIAVARCTATAMGVWAKTAQKFAREALTDGAAITPEPEE